MTRGDARAAARTKAATEREAEQRRRGRRRSLGIGVAALAVLVVAGVVTAVVLGGSGAAPAAGAGTASAAADGRTDAPPWAAPADVTARAKAAGLSMLTAEGEALHIHEHLTVTVDGRPVQVPALLGIDEAAQRIAAIHTHDATGIVHVESPVVKTFRLGQVFTEWDVALAPGRVGPYADGRDGDRVALFVDRKPYPGDPRRLALGARQDIDFVITTDGSAPKAPTTAYRFPSGY